MNEKNVASFSAEESIRYVRKEVSDLRSRLVQTEGILFAFLRELGYTPCQEMHRTGNPDNPIEYIPSVKKT